MHGAWRPIWLVPNIELLGRLTLLLQATPGDFPQRRSRMGRERHGFEGGDIIRGCPHRIR